MIHIRPVSDLRNKFAEIEKIVSEGQPVYLTKNGYGCMVVRSIEQDSAISDYEEAILDECDERLKSGNITWLTHDEVFGELRRRLNEKL